MRALRPQAGHDRVEQRRVQLLARRVGPQKVADAARAAGITSPLDDPNEGIALGNKEVSTLELASAYATIADGGVWHPPHLVSQVVTADGRVLYQASPEGERRFPEQVARNVTEAMLAVADRDGLGLGGGRSRRRPARCSRASPARTTTRGWPGSPRSSRRRCGWAPTATRRSAPRRASRSAAGRCPARCGRGSWPRRCSDAPAEPFAPFRPLGTPPSDAPPNATGHPDRAAHRRTVLGGSGGRARARGPARRGRPGGRPRRRRRSRPPRPAQSDAAHSDPAHSDPAHRTGPRRPRP